MPASLVYVLAPLIVAAAVLVFRRQRGLVRERFAEVARRCGGRVEPAPWIVYPRLVVPLEAAEMQVSGIHGSSSGRSRRTFAWVGCRHYPDATFEVVRSAGRVGLLEGLGWEPTTTGDPDFDAVFRSRGPVPDALYHVLDERLRAALLAFDARLRVRVSVATTTAYRDGLHTRDVEPRLVVSIRSLPARIDEVERLVEAAALAHDRILPSPLKQSA